MKNYYVYILKCADGSYYTGVTNDLNVRLAQHIEGSDTKSYTFRRRPIELVWFELHQQVKIAIAREKQIKKWSRRKKEALIKGDAEGLVKASRAKGYDDSKV